MTSDAPWPEPLRPAAYHGVLGEIVRAMAPETEADPAAILVQLLVLLGNVIGRGPHFRVGADVHRLNLFTTIVGPTASGRKGVSRGQAHAVFAGVDPDWCRGCLASGASSGEGLIWAIRDPIAREQPIREHGRVVDYQRVVEDAGVADKRLVVVETEFASTLKVMSREGNTLSPVLRQAWDGGDLRTLTKGSPARATAPHVSLIAHITKTELLRYLDGTEMANGFANRFLWAAARRARLLPDGGRPVDLAAPMRQLTEAVRQGRDARELHRDAAAGHQWHAIYARLSTGRPGLLGAMTGRAEAQAMRVACLYALADMSYVVRLPHLQAALEVWRYCFDSAAYCFGQRLGDATADTVLAHLIRTWPESVTRSEITRELFGRNKPAAEVDRALALLVDAQLVRSELDRTGDGRPTERWWYLQPDDIHDKTDVSPEDMSSMSCMSSTPSEPGEEEDTVGRL